MNQFSPGAHNTGGPVGTPLTRQDSASESRIWTGDREVILRMPESLTSSVRAVRF